MNGITRIGAQTQRKATRPIVPMIPNQTRPAIAPGLE